MTTTTSTTRRVRYEVRTPLHGAADPWAEGRTVSRHRTLGGAVSGLSKHRDGCMRQGGYSEARIYDTIAREVVEVGSEEEV